MSKCHDNIVPGCFNVEDFFDVELGLAPPGPDPQVGSLGATVLELFFQQLKISQTTLKHEKWSIHFYSDFKIKRDKLALRRGRKRRRDKTVKEQ